MARCSEMSPDAAVGFGRPRRLVGVVLGWVLGPDDLRRRFELKPVAVGDGYDRVLLSGRVKECLAGLELDRFTVERAGEMAAQKVDVAVMLVAVFG